MNPFAKIDMEKINDKKTMELWEKKAWNILPAGLANINSLRSTERKSDGPFRAKYYDIFMSEQYSVSFYFYILFLAILKPMDTIISKGLESLTKIKNKINPDFSQIFTKKHAKKSAKNEL